MNGPRGTILAISASLVVGMAIGLIGGVLFARSMFFFPRPPMGYGMRGPREHRMMLGFVQHEIGLSKEQSDRIEKLVDSSRADVDSIRAKTRQQILQVLTPEQREKWERMDQHFFQHRIGPPPGGEPGDEPPPPPDQH